MFDEKGVTVSFINNVWVRVEIPILDFLQPIYDFQQNETKNSNAKKKQHGAEKFTSETDNFETNSSSVNTLVNAKKNTPIAPSHSQRGKETFSNEVRSNVKSLKSVNSNNNNANYFESKFNHANSIIKI